MNTRPRLLERITAPASEPISLSEAKAHLRVDSADDDSQITAMITGARQAAESHMHRSLITQSWLLAFDDYPPFNPYLPYGPVQSITSVHLVEENETSTAFSSDAYHLDASKRHIHFDTTPLSHRIEIRYVTGFGDNASDIPEAIRQGLLQHILALYDREGGSTAIPPSALALYRPYREVRL